jgi:hypothetical protein
MSKKINQNRMITVILSHEVKNYSNWRKVYDDDEKNRSKAGIKLTSVLESVDNPNMITMIGEAPSLEAIKNFMANPDLKAAMELGGVISKPEVKLLRKL